jgi:hypothetical protein
MATTYQRTAVTECAKCHKQFQPGDRAIMLAIVVKLGRNPTTHEMGAMLSEDFELMHASCADPGLEGKIIVP